MSEPIIDLGFLSLPPLVPDKEEWTCSAYDDGDIGRELRCRLVRGHYGKCRDRHGRWFTPAGRLPHTCAGDPGADCAACDVADDAEAVRREDR